MSPNPSKTPAPDALSRRRLFAGAGAAGALAGAAAVLPLAPESERAAAAEPKPIDDADGRYRLTQHVLRYYQTARV